MADPGRPRTLSRSPTGRHRLPRRTGSEEDQQHQEREDHEGDDDAATSHAGRLPRRRWPDNRAARRRRNAWRWIERNRTWVLPYISALFVVCVEVLAAFTKPLPESAHLVLATFWGFAVTRGRARQNEAHALEAHLAEYAARHRLPAEYLRDEFAAFQVSLRQPLRQLQPGDSDVGE